MIVEGIVLGGLTLTGFYITYQKLPGGVKAFILKHPVITEIGASVLFYEVMGMTLPAHVACATMVLGMMAGMHIARNPQEYQFLFDAVDEGKKKLSSALGRLKEINEQHMARKRMEAAQEVK